MNAAPPRPASPRNVLPLALASSAVATWLCGLSCSTRDSLGERNGTLGRNGGRTGLEDASMKMDGSGGASSTPPQNPPPPAGGAPGGTSGAGTAGGSTAGTSGASSFGGSQNGGASGGASGGTTATAADGGIAGAGGAAPDGGTRTLRIVTPGILVPVGAEYFRCYHERLPSSTDVQATAFTSYATGDLNELMFYRASSDTKPQGTVDTTGCTPTGGVWTYAAYAPIYWLRLPKGVAMPLSAGEPVFFDMHLVNSGATLIGSNVTLDIELGDGPLETAAAFTSFNIGISIPPMGKQTVTGDCTLPSNAKLFSLTTHTNSLATDAFVTRRLANGNLGEELVHTTDYTHPAVAMWTDPNFVTFAPGEKLNYTCSYSNPKANAVTVGNSALSNEMCMAIGYFFPASATTPSCN